MKQKLITETSYDYSITEANDGKELYIEGIFSSADTLNANNRKYRRDILDREINKLMEEKVKNKCCFGELGHPANPEINLDRVAILTTLLEWQGNHVFGKAKILDTPMGNIAKTLTKEGRLGISSRGLGTVNSDNYVNEDFNLLMFDLVGDPSNPGSWVNGIYEGQEFEIIKPNIQEQLSMDDVKKEYKKHIWQVLTDLERKL